METLVPRPAFYVELAGRNVSAELSPFITKVTYTDHEDGEADSLDIALEDVAGRFRGDWYPTHGDRLKAKVGFVDGSMLDCGEFEIDEITLAGPPDTVTIRALSAGVTKPVRTNQGRAYENTTLAAIAQQCAHRLKLQVVGKVAPIAIRRVTQIHENDLTFLHRLAGEYGYAFTVKGTKMVFTKLADLHAAKAVATLARSDLVHYSLRDKIKDVTKDATVSYHDAKTKKVKKAKVRDTRLSTSADELKVNVRAENEEQARVKAEAALLKQNQEATVLTAELEGRSVFVAGVNFTLSDMGRLNGDYHITSARHTIDRNGGYALSLEAKRVRPPSTQSMPTTARARGK